MGVWIDLGDYTGEQLEKAVQFFTVKYIYC